MAESFANATLAVTTSATALYTCPALTTANVYTIYLSNISGTSADITCDIQLFDDSKSTAFTVGNNIDVPFGTTLVFDKSITLEENDEIRVLASAASSCEAIASIVEST